MEYYIESLFNVKVVCDKFRKDVLKAWFTDKTGKELEKVPDDAFFYCYFPRYRQYFDPLKRLVIIACDFLGIEELELNREVALQRIGWLENPKRIRARSNFESDLNFICNGFDRNEKAIKDKISFLRKEEIERLNEALHCYFEGCNFSTVAMSVSAVESRLLELMKRANPQAKLEDKTLGQLIKEYLENKKKYKNCVKEHEHLLNVCNTYRIFSVHPKRKRMTKTMATSILGMTFVFLLDPKMQIPRIIPTKKKPRIVPTKKSKA